MKLERESNYDIIKKKWVEICKEVFGSYVYYVVIVFFFLFVVVSVYNLVLLGWVLKVIRKLVRFIENIKVYLKEKFMEGEEIGRKVNLSDVVSKIKTFRIVIGEKMFVKDEWFVVN